MDYNLLSTTNADLLSFHDTSNCDQNLI